MTVLKFLAHALAPWQTLYANSTAVSTAVTAVHIVALMLGGGLAIAADRSTLRALRSDASNWPKQLADLHAVHGPVTAMLALLFASGVLLAAADVEAFAASTLFRVKLALIGLLLINGGVLFRTETRLTKILFDKGELTARMRRSLKVTALLSISLWIVTAAVGTVLTGL